MIINQMKDLEKRVSDSFGQAHENVKSLQAGLHSAEFNLRAHQKVMNAMALELENLYGLVTEICPEKVEDVRELKLTDVDIPTEADDGETGSLTLRRIDWSHYHKEVDSELKHLMALEKAEQERIAEEKAKLEAETRKAQLEEEKVKLAEQMEELKKEMAEAGNDPEKVQEEADKLMKQFERVSEELGKMVRGEPHDQEVIAEAQQMIEEDEREHPEGATIFGG